ncbi:MAG: hypothetical protein BLM47_07050 [Candidatus Reconcilbacillus cellulovorans]|uniref:Sporulation protein n=1 Tax=Candidatus Reconcilbacillus cellulovorans TaxID=1906605 RepID=A0A2A6E023_9BACL|nr:MAG: hypothetical protein BLM47_07050 [Candidatus Reconcilbacillus cellulovorans]
MKRAIAVAAAFALLAAGCAQTYVNRFRHGPTDYSTKVGEEHELPNPRARVAPNENAAPRGEIDAVRPLRLDHDTAAKIRDLKGIRDAFVALSGPNAYVAVILDATATGTKGKGRLNRSDRSMSSADMNDRSDVRRKLDPGTVLTEKYSYLHVPNAGDLSDELQLKIADLVRTTRPEIARVHISANAEFVNLMSRLALHEWQGGRADDFARPFYETVSKLFP